MSMSTHVVGFVPPDDKWRQMKQVWDACERAGVECPPDVYKFFNDEPPDECGHEVSLKGALRPYKAEMHEGFEVDISKLPPNVKIIRFWNAY